MPLRILTPLSFLLLALTGCYEDVEDCTDPDASNYNLSADELCGDCCVYPTLTLDIDRRFGADDFDPDSTYTDGAGNAFTLTDFRYYLGDISLVASGGPLDLPFNPEEVEIIRGADTVATEVNVNALLGTAERTLGATVGRLPIGRPTLERLDLAFGLPDALQEVRPASAPGDSPLITQPRLLNYRDGRGYVQLRVEYVLAGQARSVSTFGYLPVSLPLPAAVEPPPRGDNLTLELTADFGAVLGAVDLGADSTLLVGELRARLPDLLTVTGSR